MTDQLQLPESAYEVVACLGILWGVESLEKRLILKFSRRMIRSLGNYRPERAVIHLNKILANPRNAKILGEVLCHEAAHAAVFFLFGRGCKPHGPQWRLLVEAAQFMPRTRIPEGEVHGHLHSKRRKGYRYTHRCLDCGAILRSRRTDRRWRCKNCLSSGFDGYLELLKRETV